MSHFAFHARAECAILVFMTNIKQDLSNLKQHRIVVLRKTNKPDNLKQSGSYYVVRCLCTKEWTVHRTAIIRGLKSCGCLGKEKKFKTKSRIHYRLLYNVWKACHYRCYNKNNKDYPSYGFRGIKLSKDWANFAIFYNDMVDSYTRGLTLERKNVDGDYSFQNCIWVTNEAQANNRRSSLAYRERTGYVWPYAKKD